MKKKQIQTMQKYFVLSNRIVWGFSERKKYNFFINYKFIIRPEDVLMSSHVHPLHERTSYCRPMYVFFISERPNTVPNSSFSKSSVLIRSKRRPFWTSDSDQKKTDGFRFI